MILTNIRGIVDDTLKRFDVSENVRVHLESVFAGDGPYGKLFSGLETNHLQLKYYRQYFNFVVSLLLLLCLII